MSVPENVNDQDRLLTININDETPVIEPINNYEIRPLFLDPEKGTWVLWAKFPPGTTLPKHYHTGTVHFFTLSGSWYYLEHKEDVQTAGSYLYEPGGSVHTFHVPADAEGPAEGIMVVDGANVNFDDNDNLLDISDARGIEAAIKTVCQMMGRPLPRYIKPGAESEFTGGEPLVAAE